MSGTNDRRDPPVNNDAEIPAEVRAAYAGLEAAAPPRLVDQAVLNRARAAVEKPHSVRPWSFGWFHALSTVALIVLGLTVLLQLRDPSPSGLPAQRSAPATAPTAAEQPAAAPMSMRARQADAAANRTAGGLAEALEQAPEPAAAAAKVARQDIAADEERGQESALLDAEIPATERQTLENDPEAWLAEIRRLQQAGLEEQAAGELALFRAQWPDYPIPADLDP
jgi:hypothetical protein